MAIKDALLPEFDEEMKTTRTLLERVPDAKAAWKPQECVTVVMASAGYPASSHKGDVISGLAAAGADLVALQLDALLDNAGDGADQAVERGVPDDV